MNLYLLVLLLPILWTCYNIACLARNYSKASKLGIKLVISAISPDSPLWMALLINFPWILDKTPLESISLFKYTRPGWEVQRRYKVHAELGDIFIIVTPHRNWLHVADPKAAVDIFARPKDFRRCVWMTESLGVFGPNISVSDDESWQRQRKLTTPPFNEHRMPLVWTESLNQTKDMLSTWVPHSQHGTTSMAEDIRTLALHVMSSVAFQESYPFKSWSKSRFENEDSMTYRDAMALILKNALMIMILPSAVFTSSLAPAKLQQIGWAISSFRKHMLRQISAEKQLVKEGKPGTNTLVGNLVRASDDSLAPATGHMKFKPLTESEILGNIFVYNFAGHDTTALSTASSMVLLAANPKVQDWIGEEISYYLSSSDINTWDYLETFPKLKRCLAVLVSFFCCENFGTSNVILARDLAFVRSDSWGSQMDTRKEATLDS
jgi:cytochrome P450